MLTRLLILFIGVSLAACKQSYIAEDIDLPETVDYNFHVKPILSDRCFACHGPDANKREAGLRPDEPESAIRGRTESGARAIVPGSLRRSELFHRITTDDKEELMPPAESNLYLSEQEKAILARWIEQGAEYKEHWAFLPIGSPMPPSVKDESRVVNPIDRFTLAALDTQGWSPNQEADRETMLRRVTLDLTGLPPTIEEIEAFVQNQDEDAYEQVVDRLLASDAYAERMTLEWMDVARYADSHGYSQDGIRMMWPWRDWTIQAFKDNMPFDQFVTWQIAGDLLPNATQEQRLATAFLRNQRINSEGGIVPAEYLVEYGVERASTIGTAFLGMTIECARCHDHKYDPLSQKEFYEFYAFFNNVNEAGLVQKDGNSGPQVLLMEDHERVTLDSLNLLIEEHRDELLAYTDSFNTQTPNNINLDLDNALIAHLNFEATDEENISDATRPSLSHEIKGDVEFEPGVEGQAIKTTAYEGAYIDAELSNFDRSDPFTFSFRINPNQESDYAVILINFAGKNQGYRGYSLTLNKGRPMFSAISAYPANLFETQARSALPTSTWSHFAVSYDGSGSAAGLTMYVDGKKADTNIVFDQLSQSFRYARPQRLQLGGRMQEQLEIDDGYILLDDFRMHGRQLSALEVAALHDPALDLSTLDLPIKKNHELASDPVYQELGKRVRALQTKRNALLDTLPGVMVMDDLPVRRAAYLLDRGQYDRPGEEVFPDTPDFILPFPDDYENNRLGIARWLFNEEHPLTARVTVNRYWQMYFGNGLVTSIEDFGSQGGLPTHPELLDWLARSFMESGWDIKALQKMIVMSSTYRQSSIVPLEMRARDPENAWLARGPSHRLSAETLRDQALAASGLLVQKIGGESVKPYQPPGLWSEKSFFSEVLTHYEPGTGDDLYRRSMYTFWRRTSPPPSMVLFDAPTRDNCTVRRQQTNTPLQALVLLNDPQFVEAARVLAEKAMNMHPESVEEQLTHAYRALTGMHPENKVLSLLSTLHQQAFDDFEQNRDEALRLIHTGEYPRRTEFPPSTHAALTVAINTMMSFDEAVTKR